jgi:hypothetical protein
MSPANTFRSLLEITAKGEQSMPEYNVHGFVSDKFTATREAFEAPAVPT